MRGATRPIAAIILEASLEVRSSIVHATLISLAAMTPVFLLHGLTAAFFRPLALAYVLAILASMGVALTVTPALTLHLLAPRAAQARGGAAGELAAARVHGASCRASSPGRSPPTSPSAWWSWWGSSSCRSSASRCFPRSGSATC